MERNQTEKFLKLRTRHLERYNAEATERRHFLTQPTPKAPSQARQCGHCRSTRAWYQSYQACRACGLADFCGTCLQEFDPKRLGLDMTPVQLCPMCRDILTHWESRRFRPKYRAIPEYERLYRLTQELRGKMATLHSTAPFAHLWWGYQEAEPLYQAIQKLLPQIPKAVPQIGKRIVSITQQELRPIKLQFRQLAKYLQTQAGAAIRLFYNKIYTVFKRICQNLDAWETMKDWAIATLRVVHEECQPLLTQCGLVNTPEQISCSEFKDVEKRLEVSVKYDLKRYLRESLKQLGEYAFLIPHSVKQVRQYSS